MKRLTATLYRSCNALMIGVLLLGVLPPAQTGGYPRSEPPIAHAQEEATTPSEEVMALPDEPDAPADGPSGQLPVAKAEPGVVESSDLITYTVALANATGAVDESNLSVDTASGGLLATETAEPEVANPGDLITYTITLTNTTRAAMEGLVVSDPLADGLTYVPHSAEGGEYDPRTHTLTWEVRELAAGASLSLSFQARVRGDALDELVVNRAEVRGGGLADPVQAKATAAAASQAIITPQGGTLVSRSGRVRVEFPAGAVRDSVRATYRLLEARQVPASQTGLALRLNLTTQVASDEITTPSVTQFEKPVRLTVDMTGLVDEAALGEYQRLFVGYLDEVTGRWVHLPLVDQQAGPVLTVEVDHFSTFVAGTDGEMELGWLPRFNDAQVSLFNGAFTYNYPLEIPPGRGGLQPSLNLSYSSRRIDGILAWTQSDWVGMGWNIDAVEIVRQGLHRCWDDDWICYDDKFVLVLNGTAYELKPEVQGQDYGRYRTEDESFLYIDRRNAAGGNGSSYPNTTSEYWIVRTKDGTEYQLGYTGDSEQVFGPYAKVNGNPAFGYVGIHDTLAGFRWRVDRVKDPQGNEIVYTYEEDTYAEEGESFNRQVVCQGTPDDNSERASYLKFIEYNHRDDGTPAVRIEFETGRRGQDDDVIEVWGMSGVVFWQLYYLESILVQVKESTSDDFVTVRRYHFTYDTFYPAEGSLKPMRILKNVEVQAPQGTEWVALPPLTLDYDRYRNKGFDLGSSSEWDREQFYYPRLARIDNGYGGVITATYETPDTGWWHAFNYRVSCQWTKDQGTLVSQVDYAYPESIYDRCYEDDDNGTCKDPNLFVDEVVTNTGGALVGYKWSTETIKDGNASTVAIIEHDFWLKTGKQSPTFALGREIEARYKAPGGTTLRTEQHNYVDDTTDLPSEVYFVYLQQTIGAMCESGGACQSRKTTYHYDRSGQDDTQYGNLTMQREYADAEDSNPYRTYRWWYYPNETDHIVDRVASVGVYVGGGWEDMASATWYFYDGNTFHAESPGSDGELTRVARLEAVEPEEVPGDPDWQTCEHFYRTSEVAYGYDDYGNITETIAYAGEGYMCQYYDTQEEKWKELPRGPGQEPTQPQTTTTSYDSTYPLFPVTVTNAKGYTSTTEYYGVNATDPPMGGGLPGQVWRTWDANGEATATRYTYDAFGRLKKIVRPGDNLDYPTEEYYYYDGGDQPRTDRWPLLVTRLVRGTAGLDWWSGGGWAIGSECSTMVWGDWFRCRLLTRIGPVATRGSMTWCASSPTTSEG